MATKWPGLNSATAAAFDRILLGKTTPRDLSDFLIRRVQFFHRVDIAAAGFTTQKFFNVAESEFITNWPGQSGLPDESACWFTHFGFDVEHGHDVAHAAVAGARLMAPTADVIDQVESVRGMMTGGRVIAKLGSREFVDGHGMDNYPLGKGIITGAVSSEIAAVFHQGLQFNNGEPALRNKYRLSHAVPALPGKKLSVEVTNDTALAIDAAVVLVAQVEGYMLTPSNL